MIPHHNHKLLIIQSVGEIGNKSKFPGEETNSRCEGDKQIKEVFDAWKILNAKFENNLLKQIILRENKA